MGLMNYIMFLDTPVLYEPGNRCRNSIQRLINNLLLALT